MNKVNYNPDAKAYKFEQIRDEIIRNIEIGELKSNSLLPSISEVSELYKISRVTVDRAYMHLKANGYITYVIGKGYYVTENKKIRTKILLIFNKLSHYKKMIYYGILEALDEQAKVDLQIHHYDYKILDEILTENVGKYDYYLIMPHFYNETLKKDYLKVLKKVPAHQLILIDKGIPEITNKLGCVIQDFETDIYDGLESVSDLFAKYKRLKLVLPAGTNHPLEIIDGLNKFCNKHSKHFSVIENTELEVLVPGDSYIVIEETELADLIKKIRLTNYALGSDIGIISFNETVMKELLDITVFSTDFNDMGIKIGNMIINNQFEDIKNDSKIIRRKSL